MANNNNRKPQTNSRPRKKKRKKHSEAAALLLSGAIILVICGAFALKTVITAPDEPEATQPSAGSTASQTKDDTTLPEPSQLPPSSSTAATEPSTQPTVTPSGSFYQYVTYRSPKAKPADIFKHGRNLMLLNNDYALPENFKWDLVAWANGQSVDASKLNSQKVISEKYVDRAAYQPLKNMFQAAADAGVPLQLVSAFRSIAQQDRLFGESVTYYLNQGFSKNEAVKKANFARTFSGTSEHNSGLGFDILEKGNFTLSQSFENTAQFKWLNEHAADYGFILRYDKSKVNITEIMYEPWHFRYVGVEQARAIKEKGYCLEEYIDYLEK